MTHGRIIPFTSAPRRAKATPADTLRALTGRLTDNLQILVIDGEPSVRALKMLARLSEIATIPARHRLAKAEAAHQAKTPTKTG